MSVEPGRGPVLCALDELSDPGAREFSIGEGEWPLHGFVVRQHGQVHAYVNRCPHAGHMLNMQPDQFFAAGSELLICSSHGALFEADTGYCVAGPCAGKRLRSLEIDLVDGWVVLRRPLESLNF